MMGLFIKRHAEVATEFADVAVLYLRAAPEKPFGYLIEKKVVNGVITNEVYYGTKSWLPPSIMKLVAGLLFSVAFIKGYRFITETWGKPDIIHVNVLTRLGIFALWLRWLRGIRYVITEHWSRYLPITNTYNGIVRKFLTKIIVTNAEAVSTVSQNLASAMQSHKLYNSHYMVLPNVVDTEAYSPLENRMHRTKMRFIHISCFEDRSKNISGLLRVIGRLASVRTDFECIMVGEGIDLDNMKAYADSLGLKKPLLKFTGLLENENLIDEYQNADFMVMFSNFENMPVVISESFSCGLPVVASAVGGIPEYVNQENGILVPAADEQALLEAVSYMLDHYHEYEKKHIRQFAIEHFSKQAVSTKLQELYNYCSIGSKEIS